MKRCTLTIFIVIKSLFGFSQTISPNVDVELCPTTNFPNGAGYAFVITFDDNATKFSIGTKSNCEVLFYSTPYNNDTLKASISVQFKDQSAGEHKFEIKKGATLVKTFVFTKIKSIADRTLENVPPSAPIPLCSTGQFYVQFSEMEYRKSGSTSSADEYGSPIPFYEYQLPQGWQLSSGLIGPSSTPGLVVGTNNVTIQPDGLTSGNVKVRAVNAQCGDFFNKSQWSTIVTGRPVLNLKSNGSETINVNCAQITPRTFTVENGDLASCATFTWSTTGGWLDSNGQPVTTFTTNTPSVTLTPVSQLSNPPGAVTVTVSAAGATFTDIVNVNFTNNNPPLSILGDDAICTNKPYQLIMDAGYNFTGSTVWTATPSNIVTIGPDLNDPNNDKKVSVSRIGSGSGSIDLIPTYTYSGCSTNVSFPKPITVGTVKPNAINVLLIDPYIGKIQVEIEPIIGATSYKWYKDGVLQSTSYGTFAQIPITRNRCAVGYGIEVEAINPCGTSLRTYKGVYVPPCDNFFIASPNPASSEVTVTSNENNILNADTKTIEEVRIYDLSGNLKWIQKFAKANAVKLDLSKLPTGTYFLEIFCGTYKERQQLMIQK